MPFCWGEYSSNARIDSGMSGDGVVIPAGSGAVRADVRSRRRMNWLGGELTNGEKVGR